MIKKQSDINEIILILQDLYGKKNWKPDISPLDILIKTILSQNTSDLNSFRAFDNLKLKFPEWDAVLNSSLENIEDAIRIGGLAKIKSKRIKEILKIIKEKTGDLNINFLKNWEVDEAKKWLLSLKGVGEKTAACTLIFGFNMPIFPVDTHILRVSKRLGLINDITLEKAHQELKKIFPPHYYYEVHLNLIEHGRQICRSNNPKCLECKLSNYCNYFNKNLILKTIGNKQDNIDHDKLSKLISAKIDLDQLLIELENENLIKRNIGGKKDNLTITELGIAFTNINKRNKQEIIKNLLKIGYKKKELIKLFNISKKQIDKIKFD
ncbi:MAG: endonuclease III domain-containing protein [Candidatus Helarchaeota archaeon]